MRCHLVHSSARIVSDDLLSSIPPLNSPKISGKIAAFFGGSTLYHCKAAKRLSSTLECQQYHSYHGYIPCGQKEEQLIAGSARKQSSHVSYCLAGPRRAGMSGMIDLRFPFDPDHITNAYSKDEYRGDETKHGRRDT